MDTWCAIEKRVLDNDILDLFRARYSPDVCLWDTAIRDSSDWLSDYEMVLSISEPQGEFLSYVDIYAPQIPENRRDDFNLSLARWLSSELNCRVLIDGSSFGDDCSASWSIVASDGKLYLADDYNTDFGDGEGGPIRTLREILP